MAVAIFAARPGSRSGSKEQKIGELQSLDYSKRCDGIYCWISSASVDSASLLPRNISMASSGAERDTETKTVNDAPLYVLKRSTLDMSTQTPKGVGDSLGRSTKPMRAPLETVAAMDLRFAWGMFLHDTCSEEHAALTGGDDAARVACEHPSPASPIASRTVCACMHFTAHCSKTQSWDVRHPGSRHQPPPPPSKPSVGRTDQRRV